MTILRERISWRLPGSKRLYASTDLTPEEREAVKRALRFAAQRLGSVPNLAAALRASRTSVYRAMSEVNPKPSANIALRLAKHFGVPIDRILKGQWPKDGACPMCGRMRGSHNA